MLGRGVRHSSVSVALWKLWMRGRWQRGILFHCESPDPKAAQLPRTVPAKYTGLCMEGTRVKSM